MINFESDEYRTPLQVEHKNKGKYDLIETGTKFADDIFRMYPSNLAAYDGLKSLFIEGLNGDDTISAGSRFDAIGANLYMNGGDGNDNLSLFYIPSSTSLRYGFDKVVIDGGRGDDRLSIDLNELGTSSNDPDTFLFGGSGDDVFKFISHGDNNFSIIGGKGSDKTKILEPQGFSIQEYSIWGGKGNDNLSGFLNNDLLIGGSGKDKINGLAGNDTISGGKGNDILSGGPGDDYIVPGSGKDLIYTGDGSDMVEIKSGKNVIKDFDISRDFLVVDSGVLTEEIRFKRKRNGTLMNIDNDAVVILAGVLIGDASEISIIT